jgi:Zn-dependent M16 (insulinase) family peptidase
MRVAAAVLFLSILAMTISVDADVRLAALKQNESVSGFRVAAVYLNDADQPMGARFVHRRTGFTFDLLQIESVPQGYTWVRSIPVSDQGEPHTQEHLLLGKGTTGRAFASLDTVWLSGSTGFTQQWRTNYPFNTAGGPDVFFNLFARQLDALLHPNYTDEEIRREVRNFGVSENPDHTLHLEEKGSVYNEMSSSSSSPFSVLFRALDQSVYGKEHPLSYNSGGEPSGIRTMKPEDIRAFHKNNYYLGNMGTIAAFPQSVPISEILGRVDQILDKVNAGSAAKPAMSLSDLPKPKPSPSGAIAYAEYPHRNDQQPSPMALAWGADRKLDANEQVLAQLFLENFAGDPTTNLYKLFIDSKTRTMDIGAHQLFSRIDDVGGNPAYVIFRDVTPSNFTDEKLAHIRSIITGEVKRIAELPADSAELKEFNERIANRVTELRRDLAKFVNTPPGFGFRSGGSAWPDQLVQLEKSGSFQRSVTLKPQIAFVEKLLASKKNFWSDYLTKWHFTDRTPYVVAARPTPALLQSEERERAARANAEAARLATVYGVSDAQEAIRHYRADYDMATNRIEEEAKKITPPEFVKSPPMTLDDQLKYEVRSLDGNVPLVVSTFDNMTSGMVGIALRLDSVSREDLRYVSLLPALLTRVGVIQDGKPVSYEAMSERLRKEVLALDASFSTNARTERVELGVRGQGLGESEVTRAIDWMELVLYHPDWRPENLPRIRDVVDQSLSNLRNTTQGSEESWVQNPATAYRMQSNPTYLAADSFLTRAHNALRLRWLLKDPAAGDADALSAFFTQLSDSGKSLDRAGLKTLLAKAPENLSPAAKAIAQDALKDLDLALIDVPDGSLTSDWVYLVGALRDDLMTPATEALTRLEMVRKQLLRTGGARMYMVGATSLQKAVTPRVTAFAANLAGASQPNAAGGLSNTGRIVDARLLQRDPTATKPVYVGLLAPNMKGGVIITSVPGVQYADAGDREKQLDYLASRLHAGYGAHGIFLKTIGAGLAYSNGLRATIASGRMGYYAERTPDLTQTVKFVENELKTAPRDPRLADYAVAQVFSEFRSAATYENRAEGIAADLADGQPPEQVRSFRQSILELRKDPNLGNLLFDRKDAVYGRFLPRYNVKAADVPGGLFFAIGPDKQLDAWSEFVADDAKFYKLYGRDFWMP